MMVARKELLKREPGARARATVGTPTPALFLFSLFQTIIAPAELSRVDTQIFCATSACFRCGVAEYTESRMELAPRPALSVCVCLKLPAGGPNPSRSRIPIALLPTYIICMPFGLQPSNFFDSSTQKISITRFIRACVTSSGGGWKAASQRLSVRRR